MKNEIQQHLINSHTDRCLMCGLGHFSKEWSLNCDYARVEPQILESDTSKTTKNAVQTAESDCRLGYG